MLLVSGDPILVKLTKKLPNLIYIGRRLLWQSMLKVLLQTFSIMGKSISQLEMAQAEVVVRPAMPDVGSTEFAARKKSIEAGRAAMKLALPALKAALAK